MKVLFISSGNKEFDISPFVLGQGKSLKQYDVDVDFFVLQGKGLKGYLKNIPLIKKQLKEKSYDLIHAHYSFSGWLAVLTFTNIPIVISYMGSDIYGKVNAKGKRNLKSYINTLISGLLQPFVSQIIVKSNRLAKFIYLKKKLNIVPNGIDFEKFKPIDKEIVYKKLNIEEGKYKILFLGNKANSNKNFKLLEKAINKLNPNKYELIPFTYPVNKDLVPVYINVANVVVLCSFFEGSPNIVKETMACNIPVVSVDVGDVPEVLSKTDGCYIVNYDADEMAEKIEKACNFIRTTGRKDIEHLKIENIAKKIVDIYKNAIN